MLYCFGHVFIYFSFKIIILIFEPVWFDFDFSLLKYWSHTCYQLLGKKMVGAVEIKLIHDSEKAISLWWFSDCQN